MRPERVQQHQIASHIEGVAEEESKVRRLQHFLANYELDYELVMALVLLLLPSKGKVTLSMDKTGWEFGGQNHKDRNKRKAIIAVLRTQ